MVSESPIRTRRDVITEFRHTQILDAARRVFAHKGFAKATMDEIAHAAGVAKGTLYLYYESKQALYRATLLEGLLALCGELEREIDRAPTLASVIERYVSTKVSYFEKHLDFFRLYVAEFGKALTAGATEDFRDVCFRQIDSLERAIVRTSNAPPEACTSRAAAAALFDLTRGVVFRRLLGWTDSPAEDDVRHVVDFAVRALGAK